MAMIVGLLVFCTVLLLGLRRSPQPNRNLQVLHENKPSEPTAAHGLISRAEIALRQMGIGLGARVVLTGLGVVSLSFMVGAFALFHNGLAAVAIGSLGIVVPYLRLRRFERQRQDTLAVQFKEALTSITYSIRAGASLQSAMQQTLTDLHQIFPNGNQEPIVEEFEGLVRQLRLGEPVEVVLSEWQARRRMEEITDFVAATLAVKSRGGNLAEVIMNITEAISWKIVAQAQIRAMTTEKRSEATLLTAAPAVVLALLWCFSPTYIAPLFTTSAGQVVFLIGVLLNIAAVVAVRKVVDVPL